MSAQRRNGAQPGYHRIVAKFGTNLLTAGSDRLDTGVMSSLVEQAVRLMDEGREVLIVTSGAIAAGRERLAPTRERRSVPFPQVLAAGGQTRLVAADDQIVTRPGPG